MQYIQDYDERFPIVVSAAGCIATADAILPTSAQAGTSCPAGEVHSGWLEGTQPYIKSTQVLQCPSDSEGRKFTRSSYGINRFLGNTTTYTPTGVNSQFFMDVPYAVSVIQSSATKIMVTEFGQGLNGSGNIYDSRGDYHYLPARNFGATAGLYPSWSYDHPGSARVDATHFPGVGGGANVLFVDGHVKFIISGPGKDIAVDANEKWVPNNTGTAWQTNWYPNTP